MSSPSASPVRRRPKSEEVGAPAVWIAPDWAQHPVIESFYGHARRPRASSFYEVMCSPTNATATTTLGESCYNYSDCKAADEDDDRNRRLAAAASRSRRPFGSFAYSCTTDTSEEAAGMMESPLYDRHPAMGLRDIGEQHSSSMSSLCTASGYENWNRMRRTMSPGGGIVPVPPEHLFTSANGSMLENPQAGGDMNLRVSVSTDASSLSDVETSERPHSPPTSNRLRVKLLESLREMDDRIAEEHRRLEKAQKVKKKKQPIAPANAMWSLLCGARTAQASQADGLALLMEKIGVAVSNRALNQLQRHRRHVRGILQIVTAHNPDLELTERQLDSFEVADAMLANDIKYSVLFQQHKLLVTSSLQRREATATAKLNNGTDCFEKPNVKSAMLTKLLEAVSWYRLVQRNSREETASTSVGSVTAPGSVNSSAPSSATDVNGLQELQVEKILDVLAGEEFYSDYNELMCRPDWWEVAQAHFENLIFSSKNSRICQWVLQLSKDVAAVSYEELEYIESSGRRSRTNSVSGTQIPHQTYIPQQASWTKDPPPEQILDFMERLTRRVRREFDVPAEVSKSLHIFIQRTVFPRIALLCFNQRATRDCQRKDKLWRKKCTELSGLPMENMGVPPDLVTKIRSTLPSQRVRNVNSSGSQSPSQKRVYFTRAVEAFNGMTSVVPCDLLDELMHGVVILHHEAALVLGTTQFSVETFFPLLAYVLLHCRLPIIHAQLHLLENFAITEDNANGEESYYVYCVHAAVEYVCNTVGLGVSSNASGPVSTNSSTVSTPGGTGLIPVVPIASSSPPKNHAVFSLGGDGGKSVPPQIEVKLPPSFDDGTHTSVDQPGICD
ncbi:hypothetical protein PHYBOEH_009084 [Phytophthora boehmeriae]|uniref:VPS9 domain-containing protein n=1 Tax=Phytophthora boehmeriae TaxID=109152 RepID=A0A8T1VVK7_9STRA|nr:hypothetical protein PHYBOEH_009084 [Phytophthora boehmeriae]